MYKILPLYLIILLFSTTPGLLSAQMTDLGYEWIKPEQAYYKFGLLQDGSRRFSYEDLRNAGIPVENFHGKHLQLWHLGQSVPLYVNHPNHTFEPGTVFEFLGRKNRGAADARLFENPETEQLNPEYSLFTDTATYFITWSDSPGPEWMEASNQNDLSADTINWFWHTTQQVFSQKFYKFYETVSGQAVYRSVFNGDGFASELSRNRNIQLPATGRTESANKIAHLHVRLITNAGSGGHQLAMLWNGELLQIDTFENVALRDWKLSIPLAQLDNNNQLRIEGRVNGSDRHAVALAELQYPHKATLQEENRIFELSSGPNGLVLELVEPAVAGYLWNLNGSFRLKVEAGARFISLPAQAAPYQLQWTPESERLRLPLIRPVNFPDFSKLEVDYLIISHAALMDDGQGGDPVQDYAAYRSSAAGGGYRTAIIQAEELYDLYSWGIYGHGLAIQHFVNHLAAKGNAPDHILFLGKGREYPNVRNDQSLAEAVENSFFVPALAYPASDNLILAPLRGRVPLVSNGRIAATNGAQIRTYLNKVMQFEANRDNPQTIADRAWMKKIIHLGGGSARSEQELIRSLLRYMESTAEDGLQDPNVVSFFRTSTDPVELALSDNIFESINEGAAMITFFGHAGPNNFDFNIDNPENYQNRGKYPVLLSLGCYTGNTYSTTPSTAERFCFYDEKAAVAMAGSRGLGFVSSLAEFANAIYREMGSPEGYGQGIGTLFKTVSEGFERATNIGTEVLVEQFSLHGDPALRLHPVEGPDITPDFNSVKVSPEVIDEQLDSFYLEFDLVNLGQKLKDSLQIIVSHYLPSEALASADTFKTTARQYRSTLKLALPVQENMVGWNRIGIQLNADEQVEEAPLPAARNNNQVIGSNRKPGFEFYVVDNTAIPVYPLDMAALYTPPVLVAATTDLLAPERRYIFQIDTSGAFNSPLRQQLELTQKGGLLKWSPPMDWQDGQTYYWRISPDSTQTALGYVWRERSFTYQPDQTNAWLQASDHQWNQADTSSFLPKSGPWNFMTDYWDIAIKNQASRQGQSLGATVFVNGNNWLPMWIWQASNQQVGVQLFIVDPYEGFWINPPGGAYGSENTRNYSWNIPSFCFRTDTPEKRQELLALLDSIPKGHYVAFYTGQAGPDRDFMPQTWAAPEADLLNFLENQGAVQARALVETGISRPYTFVFQKNEGPIEEALALEPTDTLRTDILIPRFRTEGLFRSPLVGPAAEWGSLHWELNTFEPETDSLQVRVYGVDSMQERHLLIPDAFNGQSLQHIDPTRFPFLQLEWFARDLNKRTPPNLNHWSVNYTGLPDIAFDPASVYQFKGDTLLRGDSLKVQLSLENYSRYPTDSTLVEWRVENSNPALSGLLNVPALAPDTATVLAFGLPTIDLEGGQRLILQLDPKAELAQNERFENQLVQPFYIASDQSAPILDAIFDGRRIADSELVSARPEIRIELRDDNPYFPLSDTSLINVYIELEDRQTIPLQFSDPSVLVNLPEAGTENTLQIQWQVDIPVDGVHTLHVKARDVEGNQAGQFALQQRFRVEQRAAISNVLNYPNPFSTSTRFHYTLSGSTPPNFYRIRIMTVSGRVVRELTEQDLGPLQIGTHLTEYSWDGTDAYGDQLANGVYLYQFLFDKEATLDMAQYENDTVDRFFKKGIGKLVILR